MFRQAIFGLLLVCCACAVYADTWFALGGRQDGDRLVNTEFIQTNATTFPANQTIIFNFSTNFTYARFDLCDFDYAAIGGNDFGGYYASISRNTTQFFAHMRIYALPGGGNGTSPNATESAGPNVKTVDFHQVFLNTNKKARC